MRISDWSSDVCSSDLERRLVALLLLDVDGGVAVHRVHQRWQVELREVGGREPAVAVGRPLHRGADAVAVAEEDVVAHPDLVAVVERSEEHTSELQSLMRNSYAVFCLTKTTTNIH